MDETTTKTIKTVCLYWDSQDRSNEGWAYRVAYEDGSQDSGPVDDTGLPTILAEVGRAVGVADLGTGLVHRYTPDSCHVWSRPTTPDTTDDQIRALRREAAADSDHGMALVCDLALGNLGYDPLHPAAAGLDYLGVATQDEARAECARVYADAEAQGA